MHAHVEEFKGNLIGERFGKYLLVGDIAVGGMAEVFLAVHKGLEGVIKAVVIKRVLPHFNHNPDFVQMFIDEARLAARLEHPNIVRTYEFGEVSGQYFTAMEYLPGEDLCKVLHNLQISRQVMPFNIAAGVASQLCAGLHFAHQFTDTDGRPLNLVHRDVNPANIVITYGGEVKIIDFGVAKSNANRQTVTGMIKGKVAYMPPEQVLGHVVDQRADVFSTGVVLWEMLTGRPLFLRNSEAATLYAIMNAPIPPPSKYRHDVPPQLDRIVDRALSRSPADRYETAEQMAAALEDFLSYMPRYDGRVLGRMVDELFGSTRAEAKRSIAQTRSLTSNISLVMKIRSEVRADLAERLEAGVGEEFDAIARRHRYSSSGDADGDAAPAPSAVPVEQPAPQRRLMFVLAFVMLAGIVGGLVYTLYRPGHGQAAQQVAEAALLIESTPSGAAVFVGGEPTGLKTPTTLTGLTTRQLAVRLELLDHAAVTANVEIVPGRTTSTHIALNPLQGRLVISGLPADAVVFVDDEEHAAGEVIAVSAGKHVVRVVVGDRLLTQQSIDATTGDQNWKLFHGKLIPN